MQHTTAARLATIRAIGAANLRPMVTMPPLDSMPAGEAGGGDGGGDAATGGGTDDTGGQAPTGDGGAGDQGGTSSTGTDGGVTPPLFQEPTPGEVQPPENATGAPAKPAAERSIEDFPPEIQAYIRELRDENASSRVKAKTALEEAQEQFAQERDEWVANLLKATGFMPEIEELGDVGEGDAADPAEQVQQLTEQFAKERDDRRAVTLELAIWKGAHAHKGNPERLTDSRSFMRNVAALDPSAPDFAAKVAAAIGTAVETDPYYRADQPAGQASAALPDVPSGGDFAGGPSGQRTEPQSVDDYRNLLRRKRDGGSD